MVRVETVLDSWRLVREDTAAAVEEFPEGDLSYRATPDMLTFGETARHILEAGHGMSGMLLAGIDNFQTPEFRNQVKLYSEDIGDNPGAEKLALELRRQLDVRLEQLRGQGPAFFEGMITRFDGQRVTRLEMRQFLKEHELTHRAQLFFCLRLKGVVPVTTRRRQARQARS